MMVTNTLPSFVHLVLIAKCFFFFSSSSRSFSFLTVAWTWESRTEFFHHQRRRLFDSDVSCSNLKKASALQQRCIVPPPLFSQTTASSLTTSLVNATVQESCREAISASNTSRSSHSTSTITSTGSRSVFGTKDYWDEMYSGRGDFCAEEYSWYYGWSTLASSNIGARNYLEKQDRLLLPGIGNDPLLLDLLNAGYRNITAQDYSQYAIERQQDLLSYYYHGSNSDSVVLAQGDVCKLPEEWTNEFDAILEKGLLDAVYLSGDGNVEQAVKSLSKTLRPGGVFISVSGVVPEGLRYDLFHRNDWLCHRDGSLDLQAGCFIFQKK